MIALDAAARRLHDPVAVALEQAEVVGDHRALPAEARPELPALLRVLLADRGQRPITPLGRGLDLAIVALPPALGVLADVLLVDAWPTWAFALTGLLVSATVRGVLEPRLPRRASRVPPDVGLQAPVRALEGLVPDPTDPLVRALAAQPWLLWSGDDRHENTALPREVLRRALRRLAGARERLERAERELAAGAGVLREVVALGEVSLVGRIAAGRPEQARTALRAELEQARYLARELAEVERELRLELRPLEAAVPRSPPGGGVRVALSRVVAPSLARLEEGVAAVDALAATVGLDGERAGDAG